MGWTRGGTPCSGTTPWRRSIRTTSNNRTPRTTQIRYTWRTNSSKPTISPPPPTLRVDPLLAINLYGATTTVQAFRPPFLTRPKELSKGMFRGLSGLIGGHPTGVTTTLLKPPPACCPCFSRTFQGIFRNIPNPGDHHRTSRRRSTTTRPGTAPRGTVTWMTRGGCLHVCTGPPRSPKADRWRARAPRGVGGATYLCRGGRRKARQSWRASLRWSRRC